MPDCPLQSAYDARDATVGKADALTRAADGREACRWPQGRLRTAAKGLAVLGRPVDADALLAYADARVAIWRLLNQSPAHRVRCAPSAVRTGGTTPWYEGERYRPGEGRRDVPPWVGPSTLARRPAAA